MDPLPPIALRTCVTCRHLEHLGQGQAVPGLADAISERWRCRQYGAEAEEFPYFPAGLGAGAARVVELPTTPQSLCPGWTWWKGTEAVEDY